METEESDKSPAAQGAPRTADDPRSQRVDPSAEGQRVGHSRERSHPGPREYIVVAVVLTVLTLVEVGVYYVHALKPLLTPILLVLAAAKFSLVALFYMHLKFDSRLFTVLFALGLGIAASILLALLALFSYQTLTGG